MPERSSWDTAHRILDAVREQEHQNLRALAPGVDFEKLDLATQQQIDRSNELCIVQVIERIVEPLSRLEEHERELLEEQIHDLEDELKTTSDELTDVYRQLREAQEARRARETQTTPESTND